MLDMTFQTSKKILKDAAWRRQWQPTPLFLSGKSHGQRSLAGYSPQGSNELDMIEGLTFSCFMENPKTVPQKYGPKIFSNLHFCHLFRITAEVKLQQPTAKLIGYERQSPGHFLSRCLLLY